MKVIRVELSDHIAYDRYSDGKWYHHTGCEALLEDGEWYWEMQADDGEIAYF